MTSFQLPAGTTTLEWLGTALLHVAWEGVAVGVLCAIVLALVRSPRLRYAIGVSGLLGLALAPLITAALLWPATPKQLPDIKLDLSGVTVSPVMPAPVSIVHTTPLAPRVITTRSFDWLHDGPPIVAQAWLAGVALLMLWHAVGLLSLSRLRRQATPIDDPALHFVGARLCERLSIAAVPILDCRRVLGPCVVGILRPAILWPAALLTQLTPRQVEALLAHELAHVKRLDPLVNHLQTLLETVLFFHPCVWWLSRRVRADREMCCDEIASRLLDGDRITYAGALLALAEVQQSSRLMLAARSGSLRKRLEHLLEEPMLKNRSGGRFTLILLTVTLAFLATISVDSRSVSASPPTSKPNSDAPAVSAPMFVVRRVLPADAEPGEPFDKVFEVRDDTKTLRLAKAVEVDDADLLHIDSQDNADDGNVLINVRLTDAGGEKMRALTRAMTGQRLALIIDGQLVSAPTVRSEVGSSIMLTWPRDARAEKFNLAAAIEKANAAAMKRHGGTTLPTGGAVTITSSPDGRVTMTSDGTTVVAGSITIDPGNALTTQPAGIDDPKLRAGDLVRVELNEFLGPNKMSIVHRVVAVDGTVKLPYVGKVKVAGMDGFEATAALKKAIKDASVTVTGESYIELVRRPTQAPTADYHVKPGDELSIEVWELAGAGQASPMQRRVSADGRILTPMLKAIKVEGMTTDEVETVIAKAYEDASLLMKAIVLVNVTPKVDERRVRTTERTAPSNPRLSSLVDQRSDLEQQLEQLRSQLSPNHPQIRKLQATLAALNGAIRDLGLENVDEIADPVLTKLRSTIVDLDVSLQVMKAERGANFPGIKSIQTQLDVLRRKLAEREAELRQRAVTPGPSVVQSGDAASVLTDQRSSTTAVEQPTTNPIAQAATQAVVQVLRTDEELKAELVQLRVMLEGTSADSPEHAKIAKSVKALDLELARRERARGEGEYYIGGHVERVGVYSMTGRRITLRQAIIAAGGAKPEAKFADIVRRNLQSGAMETTRIDLLQLMDDPKRDINLEVNDQVMLAMD
ncbi:MAG: M56 family metallopeptidase [Tepidisphaeraceae bacterium]